MTKLTLEINLAFISDENTEILAKRGILITPPISKDYWQYRVKLHKNQAIIGFPKFMTIGIGFSNESDWNTNLPYKCDAIDIYNHIKHNKRYKSIKDEDCITAIKLIQEYIKEAN